MTDLLFQPIEAIRRLQSAKLLHMLRLCARGHDFYRRSWAEAGVDLRDIHGLGDLFRLPLTEKRALMEDPEDFRLKCPDLSLRERTVWEVIHTTGSTGDPTPFYNTTHDYEAYLYQAKRAAEISGITDRDTIANLLPLAPVSVGAFVRTAANAYAIGAALVGALTGPSYEGLGVRRSLDDAVRMVERHRATVLWGVTSFVRRTIMRASELGADLTSVRMCAVTGESSTPAFREDIRERLRRLGVERPIIFDRYGSTEQGALAQCMEEGDWHNPAPEILYYEVVDPGTGEPLPGGERGAMAITHLDRRGTVLMRFLVGDIAGLTDEPCPHCGRSGQRIVGPIVRTKDLIKVKGMLVNPALLMDRIRSVPDVEEFQVVVTRRDPTDPYAMDELVLRAATTRRDRDALAASLVDVVSTAVGVRPRIEFVSAKEIYDPEIQSKAERFVDLR
jgi:phenylacetate-coenzyme A ligase PaaK-like adenylate-forming protein